MGKISFETKIIKINDWMILHLPKDASLKLPSRGMVMVKGTINATSFKAVLEPDGKGSHWFRVKNMKAGENVKVELEPTKEWIEPEVPQDLEKILKSDPKAYALWKDITPNARWDWIRWVRAVKTTETRKKHLQVLLDKLNSGMRRPCCFNRNLCSEPAVSHNWILLLPNSN